MDQSELVSLLDESEVTVGFEGNSVVMAFRTSRNENKISMHVLNITTKGGLNILVDLTDFTKKDAFKSWMILVSRELRNG